MLLFTLSRFPLPNQPLLVCPSDIIEQYVSAITASLPLTDVALEKIKTATAADLTLKVVSSFCTSSWPPISHLAADLVPYAHSRDFLTVSDGLIYYNARLVIPEAMRLHALQSLHDGHLGIVKCRSKAREAIWWPKIVKDIEQFVAACKMCQHFAPDSPEPLIPSTLPERPWQVLATDLFLHNDKHYIVTVDYYSRYFELQQLKSQTAEHVVSALKAAFARHGIPEVCVSDNGPCYASAEFDNFAAQYGFLHRTSSPRFAQSNGEAERAVRTAKEMLTKAKDIHLALLSYRSTPLENGYSPAQLLMGRQLRSTVPMTSALLKPSTPDEHALRNADEHSKAR